MVITQSVQYTITIQNVFVYKVSKVIHLPVVIQLKVSHFSLFFLLLNVFILRMLHTAYVSTLYFYFFFLYTFFHFIVVNIPINPCNPSPCGSNSICKEYNGAGSCTCLQGYFGDPYSGCKPECIMNNDCPRDKACLGRKCRNPCPGSCGLNAECRVINHNPSCSCISGFTGNALRICHEIRVPSKNKCNIIRFLITLFK